MARDKPTQILTDLYETRFEFNIGDINDASADDMCKIDLNPTVDDQLLDVTYKNYPKKIKQAEFCCMKMERPKEALEICTTHFINCLREFKRFARYIRKICLLKKCENKGIGVKGCSDPYFLNAKEEKAKAEDPKGNVLLKKLTELKITDSSIEG